MLSAWLMDDAHAQYTCWLTQVGQQSLDISILISEISSPPKKPQFAVVRRANALAKAYTMLKDVQPTSTASYSDDVSPLSDVTMAIDHDENNDSPYRKRLRRKSAP